LGYAHVAAACRSQREFGFVWAVAFLPGDDRS
jgi:hypothetical protein